MSVTAQTGQYLYARPACSGAASSPHSSHVLLALECGVLLDDIYTTGKANNGIV